MLINRVKGHGTKVAALIGGQTLGVANKCEFVPIKALDKDGVTSTFSIILAIERILSDLKNKPNRHAIAVLAVSGPNDQLINTAIKVLLCMITEYNSNNISKIILHDLRIDHILFLFPGRSTYLLNS